jgi:pilus assembly protein CpaE
MSEQTIKILIVDDNEKTRDKLIDQLRFDGIEVVGESGYGAAAYTWAQQLDIDVVIVSIEEPMARALRTIESLSVGIRSWPVLGLSTQTDRETMRKAVVAGVRDYLPWPVSNEELHQTILNIHRVEQSRRTALVHGQTAGRIGTIVAVVGVKGGIGKSTLASNVAIAIAEQTKQQIALADLDLQFGDAAVMLDLVPTRTIEQAASELNGHNPALIQNYLMDHASRVKLLAAPATPEGAEMISEDQVGRVLEDLAATNDYVIVDTSAQIDSISMRAMDMATLVLLVVVPEVPCVRRTKAALTLMQEWGYSRDKVKLIVNRATKKAQVSIAEIEEVLQYPVYAQIPEDRAAIKGISIGTPVVISSPKSEAGKSFAELGRTLVGAPKTPRRRSVLRRKEETPSLDAQAPLAQPRVGVDGPAPGFLVSARPTAPVAIQAAETVLDRKDGQRNGGSPGLYPLSPVNGSKAGANHNGLTTEAELPQVTPLRGRGGD